MLHWNGDSVLKVEVGFWISQNEKGHNGTERVWKQRRDLVEVDGWSEACDFKSLRIRQTEPKVDHTQECLGVGESIKSPTVVVEWNNTNEPIYIR